MSVNEMMTLAGALANRAGKGLRSLGEKHAETSKEAVRVHGDIIKAAIGYHQAINLKQMDLDHAKEMHTLKTQDQIDAEAREHARNQSNAKLTASIEGAHTKQKQKHEVFMHALDARAAEAAGDREINRQTAKDLAEQNTFNRLLTMAKPGTNVRVGNMSITKPGREGASEEGTVSNVRARGQVAPLAVRKAHAEHMLKWEKRVTPQTAEQHRNKLIEMHGGDEAAADKFLNSMRKPDVKTESK